jgi:hypothetical protein
MAKGSWVALAIVVGIVALGGCSGDGLKTFPVKGQVEINDGDVQFLTGSHVELKHDTDEQLRPSGKITPGGSFAIETLHQGKILPGAPAGKYKARIILGDESDAGVPKRKGDPVHKRYLNFETSGLSFTVPGSSATVSLSKK